jgi:hypothetical protein
MKERPILMRGPMVCASLDDKKWQTRRVVVPTQSTPRVAPLRMEPWIIDGEQETDDQGLPCWAGFHPDYPGEAKWFSCPYGKPGDRLWVRETWARHPDCGGPIYRATDPGWDDNDYGIKWRPSIFMPRWASRLTLEITSVRVERIRDISLDDMRAEGVRPENEASLLWRESLTERFIALWDSINAKRGYSWAVNPWVWVISYKRVTQ